MMALRNWTTPARLVVLHVRHHHRLGYRLSHRVSRHGQLRRRYRLSQIGQYDKEVASAEQKYRDMRDRYLALPVEEIATDRGAQNGHADVCQQLRPVPRRRWQGPTAFPISPDDDWIFGGDPATIKATIENGRQSAMPAWGSIIGDKGVADVTQYVLGLNGQDNGGPRLPPGKPCSRTYCLACHGADGHRQSGPGRAQPDQRGLAYGRGRQIAQSIRAGRNGVMPAFKDTLTEDKIHILTAYVMASASSSHR